jgi:DNA-binding transcriptional MerR regulator
MSISSQQNPPTYKIGEVAELLNTTPRTLRFYEEQGMLMPFRSSKGTRMYCENDIARLRVIQQLVMLDIPLRTIQNLAIARSESSSGDEASHKVFDLLSKMNLNMEKKKQRCEETLQQISHSLQVVEQCFGCSTKPTFQGCKNCSIEKQINQSRLFNLIWDQNEVR